MHHSVTEMCTCAHFCYKMVHCGIWHRQVHCGICELGQLQCCPIHYGYVIWVSWNLKSLATYLFNSLLRLTTKERPSCSALLAFCEGNPQVTGGSPSQRASNGKTFTCHNIIMIISSKVTLGKVWFQAKLYPINNLTIHSKCCLKQ